MTVNVDGPPPAARRRVAAAQESSVWSSPVPPGDEAALRSVGFQPVGTVTASVPSWPYGYRYPHNLIPASYNRPWAIAPRSPMYDLYYMYGIYYGYDDALTAKRAGGFTRDYVQGGGFVPGTGFSWQKVLTEASERILVGEVMDRLRAQAHALGAHGVVSIRLGRRRRPDLYKDGPQVHEISGTGLAVRAPGARFEHDLFSAALTGAETCALLRGGYAPARMVFGVGSVQAGMGNRTSQQMSSLGQLEVPQFSEAVEKSLSLAQSDLERHGKGHGEVIVGCRPELTFEHVAGAGIDCKVRIFGTALRRFRVSSQPDVLNILRLNDVQRKP